MSSGNATNPAMTEAARQLQICNACRYCEGYCSAFPAITRRRVFADTDITQIANLCHNCRGCHYACQYTAPHEFDLNLPRALAEVRREGWEADIWPQGLARVFQRHAWATVLAALVGFALLLFAIRAMQPTQGEGFYAVLSHGAMVAIFAPAFLLPLLSLGIGVRRYWKSVGGTRITRADIAQALSEAARLRNLSGGHGEGCNFEKDERFSQARRWAHHAVMYGFLLCFAATCLGTVMHYAFAMPAPYPFWSPPKLFGVTGGILLTFGCAWLAFLKTRAESTLADPRARAAENAFLFLLGIVAASGLALYALGQTVVMPLALALHLGTVLAFFLLTPFTKMAHGAFRLVAMLRNAQEQRGA